MNYSKIYKTLVSDRKTREQNGDYRELHHIVPRCLGGDDNKNNLVSLTAREHLFAHKLLYKMYPHELKLKIALLLMTTCTRYGDIKSSRQYEALRKQVSESRIKQIMPDNCVEFNCKPKVDKKLSSSVRYITDFNKSGVRGKALVKAINVYLTNLVEAYKNESTLHVARKQTYYTEIKSPISFTMIMNAEKWLLDNQFIQSVVIDSKSPLALRKRSYVVPSEKLNMFLN